MINHFIRNPDKCTGNVDDCMARLEMPLCVKPIPLNAFEKIRNGGYWGCQSTEPDYTNKVTTTASSSSKEESEVQAYCYNNPNCKGYYSNEGGPTWKWYIASNSDSGSCPTESGGPGYTAFYEKVNNSRYNSTYNSRYYPGVI